MRPEPRGREGQGVGSRFKFGLETPLVGRYVGENKKLVFAPPLWYDRLVQACIIGGILAAFGSATRLLPQVWLDWSTMTWVGVAVCAAGVWAYLSNERLVCDLSTRQFTRWEGTGLFRKVSRGRLEQIDAVVLIASQYFAPFGHGVLYRMVLHWKSSQWPLLVVGQWSFQLQPGQPLNAAAQPLISLATGYARALGVPFYDNSYFDSPAPQRPI